MYVLAKLKPRAETTDTLLLFTSNSEIALEEILLSIFDDVYDKQSVFAQLDKWLLEIRVFEEDLKNKLLL